MTVTRMINTTDENIVARKILDDLLADAEEKVQNLKQEIRLLEQEINPVNRKHTCGGPVWGRKTPGCPRCDDLIAGAEPVTWDIRPRESDASFSARLAAHDCKSSDCGPVCTAFDY